MSSNVYDLGDSVKLTATFTVSSVLTNPTGTPACKVKNLATGVVSTLTPTNPSTGVWTATFDPAAAGEHWFRFTGVGAAAASAEDTFIVREQRVP